MFLEKAQGFLQANWIRRSRSPPPERRGARDNRPAVALAGDQRQPILILMAEQLYIAGSDQIVGAHSQVYSRPPKEIVKVSPQIDR